MIHNRKNEYKIYYLLILSIEFDSCNISFCKFAMNVINVIMLLKEIVKIEGVLEIIPESNCNVHYLPQAIPRGDCVTRVPDVGHRTPLFPRADHQTAPHALYPTSHREGGSRIHA